jgi:hypothetical protein
MQKLVKYFAHKKRTIGRGIFINEEVNSALHGFLLLVALTSSVITPETCGIILSGDV